MAQEDSDEAGLIHANSVPPAEPQTAKPAPRRSGFWGGMLGGLFAAAAGFGVAQIVPAGWPLLSTVETQAQITAQTAQIAALKGDVTALAQASKPDETLQTRLSVVEEKLAQPVPGADLSGLETRIAALESRMTALEAVPIGSGGISPAQILEQKAAIDQVQAQMRALQATNGSQAQNEAAEALLKQATTATDAMRAEAAQMVQSVRRTAAVAQVQVAVELGGPFVSSLADLGEVPAILTEVAPTGVPTLASLQSRFPDAARAGLDAALRADMGGSWTERARNFLRAQTGARSLEPRDGDDPDAILSRAEAAMVTGDIATALAEIAALPETSQAAMSDWTATAQTRQAAVAALASLASPVQQ